MDSAPRGQGHDEVLADEQIVEASILHLPLTSGHTHDYRSHPSPADTKDKDGPYLEVVHLDHAKGINGLVSD